MKRCGARYSFVPSKCGAAVLFALTVVLVPRFCAGAEASLEYRVKAAFLLNFTKFVEWPPTAFADPHSPIEICVLGKDPFGRALDEVLQGDSAGGRKLQARRLVQAPTPQTCQVLFVDSELKEIPKTLAALPPGILTVSDGDRFLRDGGMISFVILNHRVRFDIDQSAAEKAGLKLSAKLLTVARALPK
jgi:hypothetical protein